MSTPSGPASVGTHVLDAARGRPAAGVDVTVRDAAGALIETGTTDADGRLRFAAVLGAGPHRLTFATGPWFAAAGRATFFPEVVLTFDATAGEHHHVALLLSPFAYTTYRGS